MIHPNTPHLQGPADKFPPEHIHTYYHRNGLYPAWHSEKYRVFNPTLASASPPLNHHCSGGSAETAAVSSSTGKIVTCFEYASAALR